MYQVPQITAYFVDSLYQISNTTKQQNPGQNGQQQSRTTHLQPTALEEQRQKKKTSSRGARGSGYHTAHNRRSRKVFVFVILSFCLPCQGSVSFQRCFTHMTYLVVFWSAAVLGAVRSRGKRERIHTEILCWSTTVASAPSAVAQ